ncbi:MAG TPA: orotate phosphoribosyltransferase [Buchnera sp. (in: enterobacteria)]|nr:orotate phosphoribosyltransferase [Buchnera sp. (in: enterobacteria)]
MSWKKSFIEFSLKKEALVFGTFQLKSGRKSPYFFNSNAFYTGQDIYKLSEFYAHKIIESKIHYNALFGLAYKGIPIVTSIAFYLQKNYNINIPFFFNRKEIKQYGEYGCWLGNPYNKNVIIIDDVITAGTAINNIIKYIHKQDDININISSILVALDRQELGIKKQSAVQEVQKRNNCNIFSIITIKDLIEYLYNIKNMKKYLIQLENYLLQYGI